MAAVGDWGNTLPGSSLSDFSNLLGAGAPPKAPKTTWEHLLSTVIALLLIGAMILSLAYLVLGGINWLTSGGDKQKLAAARQNVIFAIVGLIIVFVSFSIIQLFGKLFGFNLLYIP